MAVAVAVDRGLLSYSDPISKYWPEFGNHGKDKIRIEDVLRHEAGLPYLKTPLTTKQFVERDWDSIAELIADSPPVYAKRIFLTQFQMLISLRHKQNLSCSNSRLNQQ